MQVKSGNARVEIQVLGPSACPKSGSHVNDLDGTCGRLILRFFTPQTSPSRKPSWGKAGPLRADKQTLSTELLSFHILQLPEWATNIASGLTSTEANCFVFRLLMVILRKLLNHLCLSFFILLFTSEDNISTYLLRLLRGLTCIKSLEQYLTHDKHLINDRLLYCMCLYFSCC